MEKVGYERPRGAIMMARTCHGFERTKRRYTKCQEE